MNRGILQTRNLWPPQNHSNHLRLKFTASNTAATLLTTLYQIDQALAPTASFEVTFIRIFSYTHTHKLLCLTSWFHSQADFIYTLLSFTSWIHLHAACTHKLTSFTLHAACTHKLTSFTRCLHSQADFIYTLLALTSWLHLHAACTYF